MDRTDLQHDAFTINGVYLEDVISGYTTYKAVGRESLEKDIDTYENGTDGEVLKRSRYPKREIEISYIVKGSSLADLRTKMHKLQTALNIENAEIVFNDDPDCFYVGSPKMNTSVKDVKNGLTGTYKIICHDPFKYSKTITTVQATDYSETIIDEDGNPTIVTSKVLTTDNTGGYKTYPAFQVQFATDENASGDLGSNADCGYVLFGKGGTDYSVQIGDDEEKDTSSVTVVSHNFKANQRGGFVDDNTIPIIPSGATWTFNGSTTVTNSGLYLNATTNVAKRFHGPLCVYTIASGYEATGDFSFKWKQVLACAAATATGKKCCGSFYVVLIDENDVIKFAYGIIKNATNTLTGKQYYWDYINKWHGPANYSLAYTGNLGWTATKNGSERLRECSIQRKLTYDDNNNLTDCRTIITNGYGTQYAIVEDEPCTIKKVGFFFGKYGSNNPLYNNRVRFASFTSGGIDVLNTFRSGDYAEIDCASAEIILNDMPADGIGDVGNNWEDFYLDPGVNTIYVQHSPWVEQGYEPTATMTYRKRWL